MKTTMKTPLLALTTFSLVAVMSDGAPAQKVKPVPACTQTTFAAFKALPKMEYECPEDLTESDDKILKLPQRRTAIAGLLTGVGPIQQRGVGGRQVSMS